MNDTQTTPPASSTRSGVEVTAGAPEAAPRISGEFIRQALLGETTVPADSPLKLDSRGARLESAIVEGPLDLSGLIFDRAIVFERCTFLGQIDISQATLARVSFAGSRAISIKADSAVITGDFNLTGVRLDNPGLKALDAPRLRVVGSIQMQSGFVANGAVFLLEADIAGSLNCTAATFNNSYVRAGLPDFNLDTAALNCVRSRVAGDVLLQRSHIDGLAAFAAIKVVGRFIMVLTSFVSTPGEVALNLAGARINEDLYLSQAPVFQGVLRLRGTHAESFGDDGSFWRDPATGEARPGVELELDQFHYGTFLDAPIVRTDASWRTRLAWIKAQKAEFLSTDFRPQPFTRCAEVLSAMGDPHGARMILFERERLRLKAKSAGVFEKLGGHVLGALAGYGYKTHYALYWAIGVWLVGAVVFGVADRLGEMRPASEHILVEQEYKDTGRPPKDYEPVKPLLYSADILLPIVEIGQEQYWIPRDAGEHSADTQAAFPRLPAPLVHAVNWLFGGWLPKAYYYFEIAMGWILVSIVLAGFSGLLGHAKEE